MEGSLIDGRYRVDERVGEGGVAVVYRGLDLTLERQVAIKILRPELTHDVGVVERFRREAYAAAKLNHPNIVQIYDTGSDNDVYYIVMEYLPEPDFKRIIQEYAPLPVRKVLQVSIECCRALAYAHRFGIVHRDIKPHNVLFTDDGHAKLSDFGIAAAVGDHGLTDDGMVLGSAHYMSPEQAQGRAAGPASDLYSLGIVMYEALTGVPPFTGKTAAEVAAKHVQERVPPLKLRNVNIGPSVEFVVNKALMRDVARRYRNANEMLMDLEKLGDGLELDQTGVLTPGGEDATARLEAPISDLRPSDQMPPVTPPPIERSRPQAQSAPETNQAAMWTMMVAAIVVGIMALGGVIWLAKMAFYSGKEETNVQVPMLKGFTEAEAVADLTAAGLLLGQVNSTYQDDQPPGVVISQSPEAGATVKAKTAINITVNRGKKEVRVVDVVGKDLDAARARLGEAGLQVGNIAWRFSDEVPANRVMRQAIDADAKVAEGTAVDLVVSKGPEDNAASDDEPMVPDTSSGTSDRPDQAATDPLVTMRINESYPGTSPAERQVLVRITAQDGADGQNVRVMLSDDLNPRLQVDSRRLNAADTVEIPVIITGNATVEIYHNDKVVHTQTFMLREPDSR
jgi:serine/threonine protein kinase/beta-lactam-binding protein with PASTA domain